jgi:hypothetical protein
VSLLGLTILLPVTVARRYRLALCSPPPSSGGGGTSSSCCCVIDWRAGFDTRTLLGDNSSKCCYELNWVYK